MISINSSNYQEIRKALLNVMLNIKKEQSRLNQEHIKKLNEYKEKKRQEYEQIPKSDFLHDSALLFSQAIRDSFLKTTNIFSNNLFGIKNNNEEHKSTIHIPYINLNKINKEDE